MHILTEILLLCYARLVWRHCDITWHLAWPQRPYGVFAAMLRWPVSTATSLRLFWACSKLGSDLGDLGDLTAICSAATVLYEISQRSSVDLADFADRSEVAVLCDWGISLFNILRLRQNGCHFADDIFKCIFLNENVWIPIKISLKFVPQGPINNIPALVQIMAWRQPGDKPLSGPMMVRLPMYVCITRCQWVHL